MDRLVTLFMSTRRGARSLVPLAVAAALALVVGVHAAYALDSRFGAGIIVGLLGLIAVRAHRRAKRRGPASFVADLELGGLLVVAAFATTLHVDGSLDGRFYPLVYLAIGVLSAFARPLAAISVIGLMVVYEALLRSLALDGLDPGLMLPHMGFAMVFGLLNAVSLRMEIARLRRESQENIETERQRIRDEARSYRLLRAPSEGDRGAQHDEDRLLCSGVEEIQLAVLFGLRLLRSCLKLHTAMLLWRDERANLRISELSSDDNNLVEGPFSARDGILGAALKRAEPVCVGALKPSHHLPHYRGNCPVGSVCALPVSHAKGGQPRGVLLVDRKDPRAFDDDELALIGEAARFIARAIENERVFVQLERTKVDQGKLYRASERLGAAMGEEDVVDAGVRSASEIAAVDFAAVTSLNLSGNKATHQIRAVSGLLPDTLVGQTFKDNTGLVAMALRNRHPLPYRGEYDARRQMVFDKGLVPPEVPSLLVLPLVVHDTALGALVLGSRERGAFHDAARSLLEVLASHLAVSLSNARMVRRLEEQATTDGLTGLLNKRAMLDTAEEKLRAARRFGRRLSVLVADIDHFKRVNDTYGHDVGDVVIKELGAIHQRAKRNTDAVARFGGEEFVTICEETDAEGAMLLAERIRAELKRTTFHAGGETVSCTCSVGIATFPEAGETWDDLFKAADSALYVSKRNGRDQANIFELGRSSLTA